MAEKDLEMETGDAEEDVYTEEGREQLVEDDEISTAEEGFMEGAEGLGQQGKCAVCGAILTEDNTVERKVDGELKWFCSDKCSEKSK
ncbi:MAG: hypothetical protein ACE5DM_05105 [Candidatus Nanoarchaeia archaeon]